MMTAIAGVAHRAVQIFTEAINTQTPFVLFRSYDLTPVGVEFGDLQELLAPSARYLISCQDTDGSSSRLRRWKLVKLSAYLSFCKMGKHVLPATGTVELMAQTLSFA